MPLGTEILGPVLLPDGEYRVVWGGYVVTFPEWPRDPQLKNLTFQAKHGIRTPAAPAIVTIKDTKGAVRTVE